MAIETRHTKNGRTFRAKVQDPLGNWYRATTFYSKPEAVEEEARLLRQNAQGVQAAKGDRSRLTVDAYVRQWKDQCRAKASDGWKLTQDQMLRDFILPNLGRLKLRAVTPQHIGALLSGMAKEGLSAQTQLHVYNLLHKMFDDALDDDMPVIASNPVRKKYRPKVRIRERPYLAPDEARKLLEAATNEFIGPAVWICVLTGLRSEAILPLRVGCLDFLNKEIVVVECLKRKTNEVLPYPKGGKPHKVPMPEQLLEYLRKKVAGKGESDFVVGGIRSQMLSYNTLLRHLRRLCKQAGVRSIATHGMRHSTSELWYEMGASEEDVARLLDQKSTATTKRYKHRADERLKRIAVDVGKPASGRPEPTPPPPGPIPMAAGDEMTNVIRIQFGKK
jgi:integrase